MSPTPPPARILGRQIEIHNPAMVRGRVRYALFDFDGTLSLIRAGWQQVMLEQCVAELRRTPTRQATEVLRQVCRDFITRLTGEQTIYQMIQLAEEVTHRGGTARPPAEYKRQYLDELHRRIAHRLEALQSGRDAATRYLVRGALELLQGLARRGTTCYLASGTDEEYVHEEARLLGLHPYFGERIYGAREDYLSFSKLILIQRLLREEGLEGSELAVFGDGYVEIQNGKQVGGLAVGAATCEDGSGGWDEWKRGRLLEVGADLLVPHWEEAELLLAYLFAEED
ncbi:MAG: HAD family hydrolase [Candidatus Latescibacterota bacterium]